MTTAVVNSGSVSVDELLVISELPFPKLSDNHILIQSRAFGANESDALHTGVPFTVVGCEVSGVVVEVGQNVANFVSGDCVSAFVPRSGAFALLVVVDTRTTIRQKALTASLEEDVYEAGAIVSFEAAAAVPRGLLTAGWSFSHICPLSTNRSTVLIWGDTPTSFLAVQVATRIYRVHSLVACSARSADLFESLGATIFLEDQDDVVDKIRKHTKGSILLVLDTRGTKSSVQNVYNATLDSVNVTIDTSAEIGPQFSTASSRNVRFMDSTLLSIINEEFTGDPEVAEQFEKFLRQSLPDHLHQIQAPPLRVLRPGLVSANQALKVMREGNIGCQKVIFGLQSVCDGDRNGAETKTTRGVA